MGAMGAMGAMGICYELYFTVLLQKIEIEIEIEILVWS